MSKYEKGDKFIIEIEGQIGNLYKIKGFNALVFDNNGLDRLGQMVQGVDVFSYQKGAEDAWKLARKIETEYTVEELIEMFGNPAVAVNVLGNCAYSIAAARVEEWEKERGEIRVGDVYYAESIAGEKIYITVTRVGEYFVYYVRENGEAASTHIIDFKDNFTKTGRHIDIESLLAEIQDEKTE